MTTVSASIVDSDSLIWQYGTVTARFIPNPTYPSLSQYTINGASLDPNLLVFGPISLGTTGSFSLDVYDNALVTPAGSMWQFTVCPKASFQCTVVYLPVSGTTFDLTAFIASRLKAPRFRGVAGSYGYADLEVMTQPGTGATYYNVVDRAQRYYDDITGTWTAGVSGGGGGGGGTTAIVVPRGLDAVVDLGLVADGVTDNSPVLQNFFNTNTYPAELHFPPGKYYFGSTVNISSSKLVKLIGDGQVSNISNTGSVTFQSDLHLDSILWFNTPSTSSNLESCWIEHIQFCDSSSTSTRLKSAIRITNQANFHIHDCGGKNLIPARYTIGTISVVNGSTTVTGSGTSWDYSDFPGWLVVNGYPYEVATYNSGTSLTLAVAYQGATASNVPYVINIGGIFLWLDPGVGFTQYGQVLLKSHTVGCPVFMSGGTGATGTSRVKFHGYVVGGGIPMRWPATSALSQIPYGGK